MHLILKSFFRFRSIHSQSRLIYCQTNCLKRWTTNENDTSRWRNSTSFWRQHSMISTCLSENSNRLQPSKIFKLSAPQTQFSQRLCDKSLKNHVQEDGIKTTSNFQLKPAHVIEFSDDKTKDLLFKDIVIYEDFLSTEEENCLIAEIEPYMRKLRYEYDHWDDAIHGYRETEKKNWNDVNETIIQRVRDLAFPPDVPEAQLAFVHILDLDGKGFIKPHIDSVRFCGCTITGLSLLSNSVMRLVHADDLNSWANILLRKRSLYIMRGAARYQYTHEILADQESFYKGQHVPRHRRISVMCRNEATGLGELPPDSDVAKRY